MSKLTNIKNIIKHNQELLTILLNNRVLCLTKSLSLAAKSHFVLLTASIEVGQNRMIRKELVMEILKN